MKITTIVGARPQFVKAAVVSRAMREHEGLVEVIPYPCPRSVQGLIQISPDLETLFGESASAMPPSEVLHLDRTRAHWKTATRAVKAAKALVSADLADMAQPHLQEVFQTGFASLQILHGVDAEAPFDSEPYGPNIALAEALYEYVVPDENGTGEPSPEILNLLEQLDKLLLETK